MIHEFAFRFRAPAGGLAVNLRAEVAPLEGGIPAHSVQIHRNIWLGLPTAGLHWKDAAWLAFGVSLNARALSELVPDGVLLRTSSLDCPLSDYRSEAAALAMDGWLHERFDLESSGAAVTYDASRGGFAFSWGETADPFSDAPP
ncbi:MULTISPECIES: hypothetical protein [Streptomyces]|uniref:hypothetical protein n=1 Tax=Streptomyces TaxID=1883 RepID=UPI00067E0DDD|nr:MULTISPECIES: hypothetical protein [Streptomyces]MDX2921933.1 hypothetical protein [Streptomyces sp. NE06-03C]MDX3606216.1 hypothetical protein [Streptomyces sp. FL06-04B]MDX3735019.1 hypothetical protein [Streptomyces sp. ID01-15D]